MTQGILVATTSHLEWLLPWWWMNYKAHNRLPVAFVDLGMGTGAKKWCRERGEVISLEVPDCSVFGRDRVDPKMAILWEKVLGTGVWDVRLKWFKKPFAFAHSPFLQTVWLDLDCEVRGSLDSLFSYCRNEAGIALAREADALQQGFQALGFTLPGEVVYNTGVVVYQKGAPILDCWIEEVKKSNQCYISDQEALSRLLFLEKPSFKELPPHCNWDRGLGPNAEALIFHWHGQKGKEMIRGQIEALATLGVFDCTASF